MDCLTIHTAYDLAASMSSWMWKKITGSVLEVLVLRVVLLNFVSGYDDERPELSVPSGVLDPSWCANFKWETPEAQDHHLLRKWGDFPDGRTNHLSRRDCADVASSKDWFTRARQLVNPVTRQEKDSQSSSSKKPSESKPARCCGTTPWKTKLLRLSSQRPTILFSNRVVIRPFRCHSQHPCSPRYLNSGWERLWARRLPAASSDGLRLYSWCLVSQLEGPLSARTKYNHQLQAKLHADG